jgi:Tfp pilus assembly protein PilN
LYQIQTINELKHSKPPRILLLREMARVIPSPHWVSKMKLAENNVEIELQSSGVTSDIINVLEASPYFKNVRRLESALDDKAPKDQAGSIVLHMDVEDNPAIREQGEQDDPKQ